MHRGTNDLCVEELSAGESSATRTLARNGVMGSYDLCVRTMWFRHYPSVGLRLDWNQSIIRGRTGHISARRGKLASGLPTIQELSGEAIYNESVT